MIHSWQALQPERRFGSKRLGSRQRPARRALRVESLEPRHLLAGGAIITEFLASNGGTLCDDSGATPDWIEVYNPTQNPVNLGGWSLTDDPAELGKWQFPEVLLGSDAYLVVFASGKDQTQHELHTSFKLKAAGEYLALVNPDGEPVSEFGPNGTDYPPQAVDVAYGIVPTAGTPAGQSSIGYLMTPTPGSANSAADAIVGPRIRHVTDNPGKIAGDQDLVIAATVAPAAAPVESVRLVYRVMFGADTSIAMTDDGHGADLVAGDGRYTAVIPHQAFRPGEMLRWHVLAWDMAGNISRAPLFAGWRYDPTAVSFAHDFDFGSADGFVPQAGTWNVVDGRYEAMPDVSGDALATIPRLSPLPGAVKISALLNVATHTGLEQNAALVFDYHASTDFKFLLMEKDTNTWRLGTRDASGWKTLAGIRSSISDGAQQVSLEIDGSVARLMFAGVALVAHDFGTPLNDGLLGLGSRNSAARFDHVVVRSIRAPATDAPEYFGTVVADPSIETSLPTIQWYVEDPRAVDTDAGTRSSLYFDGEFYDNVFVRIRGATARNWPKKSYKVEFNPGHAFAFRQDVAPADEINLNSTFTDKSYLRAVLAYEFQRDAGTPSPEAFPVQLRQNGHFFSVAIFVEQPDADYLRRNGLDPAGALYKASSRGFEKKTHRNEDGADLEGFLAGVAQAGQDLETFLFDQVDLPAQINLMATNVVMQNIDAAYKNYYLYRDTEGSGEWHMMPWDLDLTFGPDALNTDTIVADENTAGAVHPNAVHPFLGSAEFPLRPGEVNPLLDAIIRNGRTRAMFLRRIRTLADRFLATSYFRDRIDRLVAQLAADVPQDLQRWGADAHFGQTDDSLLDATARIKNEYLARRLPYLTAAQGTTGVGIPASQPDSPTVLFGAIEPVSGSPDAAYIELINPNTFAVDISGWQLAGDVQFTFRPGTVIPAGESLYVAADRRAFRARSEGPGGGQGRFVQGDYSGHLPTAGATLTLIPTVVGLSPAQANLRITELNYHPYPALVPLGDIDVSSSAFEFIELANSGHEPLDLQGVTFTDGIDFTFGTRVLDPGARILIVRDRAAFESRYGPGYDIAGQFQSGKLNNSGETIRLEDRFGGIIVEFTYSNDGSWPDAANGHGSTLEVVDLQGDYNDPANWRASRALGGTPGGENAGSTPGPNLGDLTLDGAVDPDDVQAFVLGMSNAATYAALYGLPPYWSGDTDRDGDLDVDDIRGFVALFPDEPVSTGATAALRGDMDLDGVVDFDDIDDFVLGLNAPDAYQAIYGVGAEKHGDLDGDGDQDFDDIHGFVSVLSGTPFPEPFHLLGPAGTTIDATPRITWEASRGAESYELIVSTASDCSVPVVTATIPAGAEGTSFTPPELAPRIAYYACVRARNSTGTTPASNTGLSFFVAEPPSFWADTRGLYVFNVADYLGPWAPREWTLPEWETWLDTMEFLGLNHLQLPRAPWSERPAQTPFETAKEDLWVKILESAKARGMATSIVFGTTWHGDLVQPWRILSPGNSPADPNWQTLVADYNYWANRYGPWVDEWTMGVEDPGGSPSSAGISWPYETPSPLGDPSNVSELVALELEMRSAAQRTNPSATVVAETWGLHWWGLSPGYASHLDEFLSLVPTLPPDVPLSTHAQDNSITDTLQATGREVNAWPFFLLDHEFPAGHTKLHFNWTKSYLQQIHNQGMNHIVAHISHPLEQLPSLYVYSRMLEDPDLDEMTLLHEFASRLVSDPADQVALANAISNLGSYWDSVSGIANWNAATLQPIEAFAPYASRYNATQIGYLDAALANIHAVDSARDVAQIPMSISAEQWVQMLADQIQFVHDAANMGSLVEAAGQSLDDGHPAVAALQEPLTRADAQAIVDGFLSMPGPASAMRAMADYILQFCPTATGLNQPLGIIYDFLVDNVSPDAAGAVVVGGDFLEYDAPSFPPLFKKIEGLTEETDPGFSYVDQAGWVVDTMPGVYSGGTARVTALTGNAARIIFAGTGISLVHSRWNDGALASWEIDGGAAGAGTVNMFSAIRQDQIVTPLASGLEPTLHILTISHSGTGSGNSILVDAVQVQNAGRLRREDARDFASYSGNWTQTSEGTPSSDQWHYTLENGASVTIPFPGTAVALIGTTRGDYGTIAWEVDGGAAGAGTVSLASPFNAFRKPFILTTGLTDGPHTLTLTKQSGFLVNIDAIDSVIVAPAAEGPWAATVAGTIDGFPGDRDI